MSTLKPYADYKDSGTDLIGKVPVHWGVARMRSGVEIKKNQVGSMWDQYLLLSLTLQGVIPRDLENRMGKMPADFTTYQAVERGDLIFCLFDVEETPRTVGWVPKRGMLTGAYTAASIRKGFDSRYVAYHYLSFDQRKAYRRYYAGLRNTIRSHDFSNIPLAQPPLSEQRAISSYLDHETSEIDAFIGDQEELIELLKERRAATITQSVTKGLDEDAEMKDSGVEWLGKVPAHWTINKFGRCVRISSGQVDPRVEPFSSMVLIAPNHVESGTGKLLGLETAEEQGADSGKYEVAKGHLIYSKIRPNLMKVVTAPVDCLCSADMYGLNADPSQITNDFLKLLLLSRPFHDYAVDQSMRVAMPKLNHDTLKAVPLWFPSLEEQETIVKHVEYELDEIDAAIADAKEAIELSKERRAALISAAVTGKIDVRNHITAELGAA
jgi:type I restriction enzyme S subunit